MLPSSLELSELFNARVEAVPASAPLSITLRTSEGTPGNESVCLAGIVALALNQACKHKAFGHFYVLEHRSATRVIGHPCDLVYTGKKWDEDEKQDCDTKTLDDRYNDCKAVERYFDHFANAYRAVIPMSVVLSDLFLGLERELKASARAASVKSHSSSYFLTKDTDANSDFSELGSSSISYEATTSPRDETRDLKASVIRNAEINGCENDNWNNSYAELPHLLPMTPPASIYSLQESELSSSNNPKRSSQKVREISQKAEQAVLSPTSSPQYTSRGERDSASSQNQLRWAIPRESRSKIVLIFTATDTAILSWLYELETHPDTIDKTDELSARDSVFVLGTKPGSDSSTAHSSRTQFIKERSVSSLEAIAEQLEGFWENETGHGQGDSGRVGWQELKNVMDADPKL
ncbi:MAG: hypothetical protein Q9160_009028 [Pyrenula sp. 1 TL-2023]